MLLLIQHPKTKQSLTTGPKFTVMSLFLFFYHLFIFYHYVWCSEAELDLVWSSFLIFLTRQNGFIWDEWPKKWVKTPTILYCWKVFKYNCYIYAYFLSIGLCVQLESWHFGRYVKIIGGNRVALIALLKAPFIYIIGMHLLHICCRNNMSRLCYKF